jgi:hypothetical protein
MADTEGVRSPLECNGGIPTCTTQEEHHAAYTNSQFSAEYYGPFLPLKLEGVSGFPRFDSYRPTVRIRLATSPVLGAPINLERATGLDPATFALATQCSAIELRPHGTGERNPTSMMGFKDPRPSIERHR